jgi:hypothetical protein
MDAFIQELRDDGFNAEEVAALEHELRLEARAFESWPLIKTALKRRAQGDEEFAHGFRIWTGERLGREYGPYLPSLWRLAITVKTVACILLGLNDGEDFEWSTTRGYVEVAAWDGAEHNGYPEANYHEWKHLKVRFGWRPRSWRYCAGRESS